MVIPEVAVDLYNFTGKVPNIITYTDEAPFVLNDNSVQFRSFWKDENPHARDWSFGVVARANPTKDEEFVIFNADVVNPGTDATKWDTNAARGFFNNAVAAGVPRAALLVGAHGSSHDETSTSELLARLADTGGFAYPTLTAEDWNARNQ